MFPEVPKYYDESIQLARLLAIAVERLGGEMIVDRDDFEDPNHGHFLQFSEHDKDFGQVFRVRSRRIRKELGEVLNPKAEGLKKAERTDVRDLSTGQFETRRFEGSANGEVIEHLDSYGIIETLWVSPIKTMRTVGVALVNEWGKMVAHSTRNRTDT